MTAVNKKNETIVVEKLYKHHINRVFDAFSKKASFEQWIAPSDEIGTKILLHDFKVGGQYRIEFTVPEAGSLFLGGKFIYIEPPKQICFTWVWEEPDIHAGINSLVTVDFLEIKRQTKLVITHENLSTLQATERHIQGWNGTLIRLNRFFNDQPIIQD